jgi:hypothetical protein
MVILAPIESVCRDSFFGCWRLNRYISSTDLGCGGSNGTRGSEFNDFNLRSARSSTPIVRFASHLMDSSMPIVVRSISLSWTALIPVAVEILGEGCLTSKGFLEGIDFEDCLRMQLSWVGCHDQRARLFWVPFTHIDGILLSLAIAALRRCRLFAVH